MGAKGAHSLLCTQLHVFMSTMRERCFHVHNCIPQIACLPGITFHTKAERGVCTRGTFLCREIQLLLLSIMEEKKEPTLKSNIIFLWNKAFAAIWMFLRGEGISVEQSAAHEALRLSLHLHLLLLLHGEAVRDERLQSFYHGWHTLNISPSTISLQKWVLRYECWELGSAITHASQLIPAWLLPVFDSSRLSLAMLHYWLQGVENVTLDPRK